jgi:hypothetical protein
MRAHCRTTLTALVLVTAALLATVARAADPAGSAGNPYPGHRSGVYADRASWLCRGDRAGDVCDGDLDATVVRANGTTRVERWRPAANAKVDCFYVYPTISTDPGGNSDLVPGEDQELYVVRQQAARLGSVCRVFAPVYRQITLTALTARLGGLVVPNDPALAYADVVDAWRHYVANDNQGRGVILIGHSQGAGHLTALLRDEIDPSPELRARLVSAILLGTSVQVPVGADVGGDFANVPLCRSAAHTGCVISYSSFRSDEPPPANSYFGVSRGPGLRAACTNPAALGGGKGALAPYFPTVGRSLPIFPTREVDWLDPALGVDIATPFVSLPGFLDAECQVDANGTSYLAIDVNGDPSDPRIDDVTGADITPEWGLHLVDANAAMGTLVEVAGRQARAWCGRERRCAVRPLARR